MEYFSKFSDENSIRRIGRIFLKILENSTPTFMQEHIKYIVKKLYEIGEHRSANDICNTYIKRGVDFLREIWAEHNRSQEQE